MKNYQEYLKLQLEKLESFESEKDLYKNGQEKAIDHLFSKMGVDKEQSILDICCGDGIGLKHFKEQGFLNVTGVELNPRKFEKAKSYGFPVYNIDFHDLSIFHDNTFDVVYSSHSIEHAYTAQKVVSEMVRVLKPGGKFIVILPYPDHQTNGGHDARTQIGSDIEDEGRTLIAFFTNFGLRIEYKVFDVYREPEIWLVFIKG